MTDRVRDEVAQNLVQANVIAVNCQVFRACPVDPNFLAVLSGLCGELSDNVLHEGKGWKCDRHARPNAPDEAT
jgi:hypothetical protein